LRHLYDLRHTYATFALRAGVSVFAVSRFMGSSIAMIEISVPSSPGAVAGAFSRLRAGRGLDERPYLDGAAEPVARGVGRPVRSSPSRPRDACSRGDPLELTVDVDRLYVFDVATGDGVYAG
jgi:hypothetical protein